MNLYQDTVDFDVNNNQDIGGVFSFQNSKLSTEHNNMITYV